MKNRLWLAAILVIALISSISSTGCSSFPRDYADVAARPNADATHESAWRGEWVSKGGHRGALRCILRPSELSSSEYVSRFEAKFSIFTAHYTVTLRGSEKAGRIDLTGEQDLGWLSGGIYHYEAHIVGEHFNSTYRCKSDEGEFHMLLDSPATQAKKSAESAAAR
jgi:hypothetical protein